MIILILWLLIVLATFYFYTNIGYRIKRKTLSYTTGPDRTFIYLTRFGIKKKELHIYGIREQWCETFNEKLIVKQDEIPTNICTKYVKIQLYYKYK